MDPDSTLLKMAAAIRRGDRDAAADHAWDLAEWCGKGGFTPERLP